jgi:hypothetical protein
LILSLLHLLHLIQAAFVRSLISTMKRSALHAGLHKSLVKYDHSDVNDATGWDRDKDNDDDAAGWDKDDDDVAGWDNDDDDVAGWDKDDDDDVAGWDKDDDDDDDDDDGCGQSRAFKHQKVCRFAQLAFEGCFSDMPSEGGGLCGSKFS